MKEVTMQDIDELYKKDLIETDAGWDCPVCGKSYKRLAAAENHLAEESCADFHSIYDGTDQEIFGLKVFKYVLLEISPLAKPTFSVFKKSPSYNSVMRFVTYMNYYKMGDHADTYISWIVLRKKAKYMNQILKLGCNVKNLNDFKLDIHALDLIKSDNLVNGNMDRFAEDPDFFVRCFELCRIGVLELLKTKKFDKIVDDLPAGYQERLFELVDEVVARKQSLRNVKGTR